MASLFNVTVQPHDGACNQGNSYRFTSVSLDVLNALYIFCFVFLLLFLYVFILYFKVSFHSSLRFVRLKSDLFSVTLWNENTTRLKILHVCHLSKCRSCRWDWWRVRPSYHDWISLPVNPRGKAASKSPSRAHDDVLAEVMAFGTHSGCWSWIWLFHFAISF